MDDKTDVCTFKAVFSIEKTPSIDISMNAIENL